MKRQIAVLTAALLLAGCDPVDNYITSVVAKNKTDHESQDDIKIKQIGGMLADQSKEIATLKEDLSSLKLTVQFQNYLLDNIDKSPANISEGGGNGIAKTRHGIFLISMKKIEPYLDGYRVTLQVGNTTNILLNGGEFKVDWGIPWGTKGKSPAEISASRRSKTFSVTKDFYPGANTIVDFALTPAKPEDVKSLIIGIEWNLLSMQRPRPN
jgi:hypothetical protein